MLERLQETRKRWDALKPFSAEIEKKVDLSIAARFIASSNAIEDKNALTLPETEVYLQDELTSAGRKVVDFVALDRHRDALASARSKARARAPLTIDLVRALHFDLTRGLDDRDHGPGLWKTKQNRPTTRRGRTFRYAAPEAVPGLMRDLIAGYEAMAATAHPLEAVTWFSYHFHLIHPFNDSNGRVQRLVASFLLLKAGLCELIVDPADRGPYLDALAACDSTVTLEKLTPLYAGIETKTLAEFYGQCVAQTLEESLDLIEGKALASPAEVAQLAKQHQRAIVVRLRQEQPDLAWRQDAGIEVRRLHDRIAQALGLAKEDGPLYALEPLEAGVDNDHSIDPLLRPFIPQGHAGVVGETGLALRPHPTSGLKIPAGKSFAVAIVASKHGLHVLTRWNDEAKPTVRHGPGTASSWSRSALERHLAERIEKTRLAFDAEILELNRTKDLKSLRALSQKREKLTTRFVLGEPVRAARADDKKADKADEKRGRRGESKKLAKQAAGNLEEKRARRGKSDVDAVDMDGIHPGEPPVSL